MTDHNKPNLANDELENLSTEELQGHIKKEKRKAKRSIIFAAAALVAIIIACIAWFVFNDQTKANTTAISAQNDNDFELASVGERQKVEQDVFKDSEGNNILGTGKSQSKGEYIDTDTQTWETIQKNQDYHTGFSNLAWYLNQEENLSPGSSGKFEFYLISKKDGLTSATISLNIQPYIQSGAVAQISNDMTAKKLLNGHILFFHHLDDTYGYRDWLGEDKTFTVTVPDNAQNGKTFQKGIPYKVTIYWVWPQYFRNYIYTQRSTQGDLFTDAADQSENSDYAKLIKFINEQKLFRNSQLFLKKGSTDSELSTSVTEGEIDKQISDATLNTCSQCYNDADEYIGQNIQYAYIELNVN